MSSSASFLGDLSDRELIQSLYRLIAGDRTLEAELLKHLAEVDARKLYLQEACSSMFIYCTEVLHFSESAAYNRITAARVARIYPAILEHLKAGELHLSGISVLAPHLTAENHKELLASAGHKSKREIHKLVADLQPKPAAPARVRKLPVARVRRSTSERTTQLNAAREQARARHPEPLGKERYKIQFTANRETYEKLEELRALLRHQIPNGDLGQIFDKALGLLLEDVKRKKFASVARPRAAQRSRSTASRHIPAEIRRAVAARDGGRCQFVGTDGRRCGSRERLEYHHVEAWGKSNQHSIDGIVLMCRAHNQYEGEREYGIEHMERHRRSPPPGRRRRERGHVLVS